jgi:uncharacterized protein (DUF2336 family)
MGLSPLQSMVEAAEASAQSRDAAISSWHPSMLSKSAHSCFIEAISAELSPLQAANRWSTEASHLLWSDSPLLHAVAARHMIVNNTKFFTEFLLMILTTAPKQENRNKWIIEGA